MITLFNKRKKALSKILGFLFLGILIFGQVSSVYAALTNKERTDYAAQVLREKEAALANYNGDRTSPEFQRLKKEVDTQSDALRKLKVDLMIADEPPKTLRDVDPDLAGPASEAPPQASPGEVDGCSWINPFTICSLSQFVYLTTTRISSFVLGLSGNVFNAVMSYTIYNAKANMFPEGKRSYIDETWTIFRNIVNIFLIFVIVYIGIMTIIKGTEFGTKKLLATVIAVALFLNFSMFFTKLFIDFGNIVAVNIYQTTAGSISNGGAKNSGLGGYVIQSLGLVDLIVDASIKNEWGTTALTFNNKQDYGGLILYSLFSSAIMLVAAGTLLLASFMLFIRYIMLIFLLIFSAAAVGCLVLPSLKSKGWNKWLETLIGQVMFAPAFLLMFTVSMFVINSLAKTTSTDGNKTISGWSSLFSFNGAEIANAVTSSIIPFFLGIAFLVGSIIVAKKISDMGGGYANTVSKFVGNGALGLSTWGSRKLLGGGSSALLNSTVMKNLANSQATGWKGAFARTAGGASLALGAKASKATWDPRNAIGVASLLKKTGVDMGTASKKTIEDDKKEALKLRDERASRRKLTDEQTAKEEARAQKEAAEDRKKKMDEIEAAGNLTSDVVALASKETAVLDAQVKKENEALDAVNKSIEGTQKKIEELEAEKNNPINYGQKGEIEKKIKEANKELENSLQKRVGHTKSISDHGHALEITRAADAKIKEFENNQKNVKRNYYARLAGVDPETGENAAGLIPKIQRVSNVIRFTTNGQARAQYKKEKKGKTDDQKFMDEVLKRLKKEEEKNKEKV